MSRHFTLAQAEQLLPEVEQALRDALFHKSEYQAAEEELNQSTQRIRMAGGSRVNPGPILAARARRDTSARGTQGNLRAGGGTGGSDQGPGYRTH